MFAGLNCVVNTKNRVVWELACGINLFGGVRPNFWWGCSHLGYLNSLTCLGNLPRSDSFCDICVVGMNAVL